MASSNRVAPVRHVVRVAWLRPSSADRVAGSSSSALRAVSGLSPPPTTCATLPHILPVYRATKQTRFLKSATDDMSRSALSRQAGNVKGREMRADELFQEACVEGRSRGVPVWGSDDAFHLHPMLLRNMIQSQYFQKCCENLKNWNAVVDEIYYQVKTLQPFQVSTTPSTAFCLLLRLMTMRMTPHQLDLTLKHPDSPYIRGIGFLYLRYCCLPDQVFDTIRPFLHDEEELDVGGGSHRGGSGGKGSGSRSLQNVGDFVRFLFSSRDYFGTTLPRYPLPIERELSVRLLQADMVAERARRHFKNQQRMRHFQTVGSTVMALYEDEDNPVQWYRGVIDRVITTAEADGRPLVHPKFVVTFTEYGNTETVLLGELDVLDGDWKHDRFNAVTDERALYEEVQRRDRERATAGKNWARRPPTTKQSLAQGSTHRWVHDEIPRQMPSRQHEREKSSDAPRPEAAPAQTLKRSAEQEAAIAAKKRHLMAKYG